MVFKVFLVDIKRDNNEIHPGCFCRKCHATILNIVKSGSTTCKKTAPWMPHEQHPSFYLPFEFNKNVVKRSKYIPDLEFFVCSFWHFL